MFSLVLSIVVGVLWWQTYHKHWYAAVWNGKQDTVAISVHEEQFGLEWIRADRPYKELNYWLPRYEFLHDDYYEKRFFASTDDAHLQERQQYIACPIVFLVLLALPILWVRRYRRMLRTARSNRCVTCGYDLRSTPDRCPECGADRVPSNISFIQPGQRFEMVTLVVVIVVGSLMIMVLGQ